MQTPNIGKLSLFSKKEASVLKSLKKNPTLTKTLSGNPSLIKPFENNPQLGKTFDTLQKDTALMTRMKSLKKSPSMDKLKTAISKNPSALTNENVEKLGAAVLKKPFSKLKSERNWRMYFACGVIFLLVLGAGATFAATSGLL
ncbi:hypothetical protein PHYSODRAFT_332306 [Phytophthora sojae]|uniref:Uncharacterized protein n=1 Tax=Phytophthora sojae (strain P6497) TaxID=1094619 RepID=G4ZFS0_PHYSP|nr:hypothetical protein PHYSODRAFT_332306 [Phytophthora sojae]EGZ18538.1 hypothetical protein PHYSODRAFT_332306 [Phytophthora sojae]|eukprot:XP_009527596.1 hypothetical protein PHYSODRAFT_332306 [Phytophthora sojae]